MSLPTVDALNPLCANIWLTADTAGFAHKGISPLSIPSSRPSICLPIKASTGRLPTIPLCSSVKSIKRSSKAKGSFPNSAISSSDKPAFLNCFLALNTLGRVVPATLAAFAFAASSSVPVTLSIIPLSFCSWSNFTPDAESVKALSVKNAKSSLLFIVPDADSKVTSSETSSASYVAAS